MARFPKPTNLTAIANNYIRTANDTDHQNQFDVRVDGMLTSRDRAFGRYSCFGDAESPVTPLPEGSGVISGTVTGTVSVLGVSHILGQQAVFDEVHTFSDRLLNDFCLGHTRRGNTVAVPALADTASAAFCLANGLAGAIVGTPYSASYQLLPKNRIGHCHCKDVVRKPDPVGRGMVDWVGSFRTSRAMASTTA